MLARQKAVTTHLESEQLPLFSLHSGPVALLIREPHQVPNNRHLMLPSRDHLVPLKCPDLRQCGLPCVYHVYLHNQVTIFVQKAVPDYFVSN